MEKRGNLGNILQTPKVIVSIILEKLASVKELLQTIQLFARHDIVK